MVEEKEKPAPSIIVACREIKGKMYYRTIPLKPGLVIKRAGREYQVDANGTQRRIK
jgi:hypothetical protein